MRGYKDTRINDPSLIISKSPSETLFFCRSRGGDATQSAEFKEIEGASLDNGIKYKYVSYEDIPKNLINAFISIEDKRFYEHNGIDYLRSGHAVLNYVFGGKTQFGGSTITQQLVKNLTGNDEVTVDRKIREAFSSINLEKEYDKTEILEMYLNIINMSDGCRGIAAAAEHFFSKDLNSLTLAECATLASITNNPSRYNPRTHPENALKRRNTVLDCMLELEYITQEEYTDAKNSDIDVNLSQEKVKDPINSWYIDMVVEDVIDDLSKKYNVSRSAASLMLYSEGYRIYTAMDMDIQKILDGYFSDLSNFPAAENGETPQASMIVIDQFTGDILGVAGGVGEKKGNRVQNYATDTKRPSGSAIKPLSVYAPALEKGLINWSTVVSDSPVDEGNGKKKPWPSNANNRYEGNVNIAYAVKNSLNTVAVRLLRDLGNDVSFDFVKNKLMIESLNPKLDMTDSSLALGQQSYGITLRELVGGYTIFNEGIFTKPRSYFKVTDCNGTVILDNTLISQRAISRENAAIMTKLLEGVVDSGSAKDMVLLDKKTAVAGKTGTSQFCADRYFIAYTPELLAGVWFGYDYPRSLSEFGGNYSIIFWDEVMTLIYDKLDSRYTKNFFSVPNKLIKLSYDKNTGKLAQGYEEDLDEGWFVID